MRSSDSCRADDGFNYFLNVNLLHRLQVSIGDVHPSLASKLFR